MNTIIQSYFFTPNPNVCVCVLYMYMHFYIHSVMPVYASCGHFQHLVQYIIIRINGKMTMDDDVEYYYKLQM